MKNITDSLTNEMGNIALSNITEYLMTLGKNLLAALLIYVVGKFIIGKVLSLIRRIMTKREVEPTLFSFLDSLCTIGLYGILIVSIVAVLGVETSSLVALFASAGVAIGMALSGTLQNFAGGVMILIFHPFRVGDFIEAQGNAGTVRLIQIFSTIITTPDNQTIIIPNGGLATGTVKNYSKEPVRRVDIDVNVAYGTNPEDVRKTIMEICKADERILKEEPYMPALPMTTMADSSITFQLRAWTKSEVFWPVKFETTEKIYNSLNAAGISIPFPQLDVHLSGAKL
ncbi:MAG: mechanosensitive ion channel [Bacteroidaceae bacterium]|nr:mechanosensitive ion channel [Bacteroidaceae bacterium]